ncbi:hypothetical protein GCM10010297_56900 [Streptomyces malachitofuscus]|nr:hypothetical protein GCM10010297_56900 [Streptomyces malachitofuscus]
MGEVPQQVTGDSGSDHQQHRRRRHQAREADDVEAYEHVHDERQMQCPGYPVGDKIEEAHGQRHDAPLRIAESPDSKAW